MSVVTREKEVQKVEVVCLGEGWQKMNSACNRVIVARKDDIRIKKNSLRGTDKEVKFGVFCQRCGCFTRIPREKLPSNFIKAATQYQ